MLAPWCSKNIVDTKEKSEVKVKADGNQQNSYNSTTKGHDGEFVTPTPVVTHSSLGQTNLTAPGIYKRSSYKPCRFPIEASGQ